ncbi:MAG: hypothetical protein JO354_09735 [Verrucomicrobia bacterium]|nr:hypothetical protein [Verrucomicrobiota bacterium]
MNKSGAMLSVVSALFSVCADAQTARPSPGEILLHASQITLGARLDAPLGSGAVERALRDIGQQIDAKRASETARSQLAPMWDLAFWRYLPADPAHTLNSPVSPDDDLFSTPEYLKLSARQLEYELRKSERHDLFR